MSFLTLHSVSVSIGSVHPLDGISMEVDKGQILGVVGESGSGKSINGVPPPMSGSAAPSLKQEKVRKLKEFIFLLQHTYLDIKTFIV